jgi:hypothetical protein
MSLVGFDDPIKGLSSSPPPAPVGLRGVAVVQREVRHSHERKLAMTKSKRTPSKVPTPAKARSGAKNQPKPKRAKCSKTLGLFGGRSIIEFRHLRFESRC